MQPSQVHPTRQLAGATRAGASRMWRLRTLLLTAAAVLLCAVALATPFAGQAISLAASADAAPVVQTSGILAIVGGGGTSLLDAPGGGLVQALPAGANLTAYGRSADSVWTAVQAREGASGWVSTADILMFGGSELPILTGGDRVGPPGSGQPVALPTPTATPEATATPTPAPTATPVPAPTNAPQLAVAALSGTTAQAAASSLLSQVAVVRAGGAELVNAPGGQTLLMLPTGTALTVSGRSDDSAWLAAITPQGIRGWVPAANVVAFNIGRLPVALVEAVQAPAPAAGAGQAEALSPPPASGGATPSSGDAAQEMAAPDPVLDLGVTATVALTDSRLNVRTGPGVDYRVLAKALPGERFAATGRSEDSSWIQIAGEALGSQAGWVAEEFVSLTAPRASLPVAAAAAALPASGAASNPSTPAASQSAAGGPFGLGGNLVVQTSPGGDIYVVDMDSGASRYLVSGFDPAISPDGTTVAFTRDGGGHGLYLIGIDGGNERRIYAGGEGLRAPTFSPDGRYVLFSRLAGEYECRDVGFGICLPDNPFLSDFDLITKPEYGLSRVNTDGGDFLDLPTLTSAKAPSWSERGITYQSNTGLELTSDEPGATTRLLLNASYYQDPDWQPNSDRVIFQSREGSHWEIFSVADDGNGLFALTKPVTTLVDELPSNVAPAWSPDGQHIVYLSNRDEGNSAGEWRLWIMDADGGNQRPLGLDLPIEYTYAAEQSVDWGAKPGG